VRGRTRLLVAGASLAAVAGCGTTVHTSAGATSAPGDATLSVPSGTASTAGAGAGAAGNGEPGAAGAVPGGTVSAGPGAVGAPPGSVPGATGPAATGGQSGPIKVGFMYSLNDAAPSAGVDNNVSVTPGNVVHALVDSYNHAGGFAGRHIDAVYEQLKSSSNDYEGDLAAACASFTQDNHVAAVFVALGYFDESFFACLAKAGVPVISADTGPDRYDARQWPLLVTPDQLLGDTRLIQVVDRLHDSGWLSSHDRMGVVIEDCPVNQRIYANGLKPELQRLGIPVAATASPHCFQRIGDLGAISAQMGNAVLQFRQRGVTKVIVVSAGQEGTMTYEFMLAAGNQSWYPGYALSSNSFPTTLQAQSGVPEREFANARGIGWIPPNDTVKRDQMTVTAATRACLSRVRAQGLRPSSANDNLTVDSVCDIFDLYDATLHATRGNSSAAAVQQGIRQAGRSHQSALTLGGASSFWDNGRLAPSQARFFQYDSDQGGFVYAGAPFEFTVNR
jgi:hypothetical protein